MNFVNIFDFVFSNFFIILFLIVIFYLFIKILTFLTENRFILGFIRLFTSLLTIFIWLGFTGALLSFILVLGLGSAITGVEILLFAVIIYTVASFILFYLTYLIGKKRKPYLFSKKTKSSKLSNGIDSTLIDDANKAYIRRDYQAAYKLYCEAELVQELDTVSSRFKALLMKRLVLVEKGS